MTKSISSFNRTDTSVSGVTSLSLPMAVLNYGADFKVKVDDPSEAIITNLTSPIDKPERFRYALTDVKDIYKNADIDSNLYAVSKRGISLLCQLTDTWTITDSTDATYESDLPVSGHIVLKIPSNQLLTSTMVKDFIGRLVAGLFATGVVDTTRLQSLLRGSLIPSDM